jgi:hypothetical protein
MKNFYEYLASVKKEYNYVLKFAFPIDDVNVDKIESVLKRYDAIEITSPKKSILHHNKMDFPDLGPIETYMMKIVTERPLSTPSLINDLKSALNVSERMIRVRGENEPVQVEVRFAAENQEIEETNDQPAVSKLGNEEVIEDQPKSYGDEYNQGLLNYLAQLQANRAEEMDNATPHKSMFGWLNDQTANEDAAFNKDKDGVRPVSGSTLKAKEATKPLETAPTGNFDSRITNASKTIKDGNGNLKKIKGK